MKRFNEWLAVKLTQGVGSMTCAYLFFLWALLPLGLPQMTNTVSYVSQSIIQLVLLSVIMVGQDIASRRTEERAEQDHQTIMAEFNEIRAMHQELHAFVKGAIDKDEFIRRVENHDVLRTRR